MKHNTTHMVRLQNRIAINRGYATPLVTVQSRALLASIHGEVAPVLVAMRQADTMMSNCGVKGRPAGSVKGCEMESGALDKYNHEFTLATGRDIPGDLASVNSEFARLYAARSNDARENTQTTAGGIHSAE